VATVFFLFISAFLIIGGLTYHPPEPAPEKEYIERLQNLGYWVKEKPLQQPEGIWREDRTHFEDFLYDLRSCEWRVDVYIDRERKMLYFFQPVNIEWNSKTGRSYQSELIVFYYNK